MHRIDDSVFLLYIEPDKNEKSDVPVNDELTKIMEFALSKSIKGTSNYSDIKLEPNFRKGSGFKGFHRTDCGMISTNNDYLLENGMITNSLCVYYIQYYRDCIPDSEMKKVKKLLTYYKNLYSYFNK
jgi:hypothetical protein